MWVRRSSLRRQQSRTSSGPTTVLLACLREGERGTEGRREVGREREREMLENRGMEDVDD